MINCQMVILHIKLIATFPNVKEYLQGLNEQSSYSYYLNGSERHYNAHIKARALAGCYKDKNGMDVQVLVILVKEPFGDLVIEFNAKCLIFTKFNNPDVARALNQVVKLIEM